MYKNLFGIENLKLLGKGALPSQGGIEDGLLLTPYARVPRFDRLYGA